MNTPIAMPKPTGSAKKPPEVQKEDAMWLQKELINRNYMELATARAQNRKVSATWNVRPTPRRQMACGARPSSCCPSTVTEPASAFN